MTVIYVTDGMDVTVPLSLIGSSDGRMNVRVQAFVHLPGMATSGALDVMPDVGLPSMRVQ